MLAFGSGGVQSIINPWIGFAVVMAGWAFIFSGFFVGKDGQVAQGKEMCGNFSVAVNAFQLFRLSAGLLLRLSFGCSC